MKPLIFKGFRTSTDPIAEGDVAVVIRKTGHIEAVIQHADELGREQSADPDDILTAYGLILLANDHDLITTARSSAMDKVQDAMKLRSIN
ncbi:MAG: hypothetical protein NXH70_02310 [Hyphomonas sp.]|nr:hypothetical protein [Hyphomonas sp.]